MTEFLRTGFLVRVRDRTLSVIEVPAIPVLCVPATAVRIATPRSQRRLGCGSILRIHDELWSVQFGSVYQVETARLGRRGLRRTVFGAWSGCGSGPGAGRGSGSSARFGYGAGFGTAARRAARRARELNDRFVTALLRAGAIDEEPSE